MELPLLRLVVEKGPRKGEKLERRPGKVARIGRVLRGNDLGVRDSGASQNHLHFEFLPEASRWAVSDLDTSNGTIVNDGDPIPPLVPFPLSHGDVIKIGASTSISVEIVGAGEGKNHVASGEEKKQQQQQQEDVEEHVGNKDVRRRGRRAACPLPPMPPPPEDSLIVEDTRGEAAVVQASKNPWKGRTRQIREENLEEEAATTEQVLLAEKPKVRGRRPASRSVSAKSTKEEDEVVEKPLNSIQISDLKSGAAPVKGRARGGRRAATRSNARNVSTEEQESVEDEPFSTTAVPEAATASENGCTNSKVVDSGRIQEGEPLVEEEMEIDLDKMTMGEWFDRMEKLLPRMISDVSDEIITNLQEKARLFEEFIATSSNDI